MKSAVPNIGHLVTEPPLEWLRQWLTLIPVRFEWDPAKEAANRSKHGLSFGEVTALFTGAADYLEIPDMQHDDDEERFIAIGPIRRGIVLVVFTERFEDTIRIISARRATRTEITLYRKHLGTEP